MKKWMIGCLVTGLVLFMVVGGAAYWFIWRPLSAAGGDIMSQAEDMAKIGKAEQAVKNQSAYTAPADGKLSAAQVTAFIATQQIIADKMGPDFALMEDKYKKMGEQDGASKDPSAKEVMGAFADMTRLMAKAKQAQVAGLNMQNMSMEEYRWIRDQVNAAMPYLSVDIPESAKDSSTTPVDAAANDAASKAQKAAEEAIKQNMPAAQEAQGPENEAIRANAELLRPHKKLLLKTMTAAWMAM